MVCFECGVELEHNPEADEEYNRLFGDYAKAENCPLCDTCYNRFLKWYTIYVLGGSDKPH